MLPVIDYFGTFKPGEGGGGEGTETVVFTGTLAYDSEDERWVVTPTAGVDWWTVLMQAVTDGKNLNAKLTEDIGDGMVQTHIYNCLGTRFDEDETAKQRIYFGNGDVTDVDMDFLIVTYEEGSLSYSYRDNVIQNSWGEYVDVLSDSINVTLNTQFEVTYIESDAYDRIYSAWNKYDIQIPLLAQIPALGQNCRMDMLFYDSQNHIFGFGAVIDIGAGDLNYISMMLFSDNDTSVNVLPIQQRNVVELSIDDNYVLSATMTKPDGTAIGSPSSVDLPLESMVVNGRYADGNIYLTLQNGNEISFSVSTLVSGLVPTSRTIAGENLGSNVTKAALLSALNVEDGAEANVQPDWDATSGDSAILHKPTLPQYVVGGDGQAFTIRALTQAQYNAITNPSSTTLYLITG